MTEVYQLAQIIDLAPHLVILVEVEVADVGNGVGLTRAVELAIPHAVAHIIEFLEQTQCV